LRSVNAAGIFPVFAAQAREFECMSIEGNDQKDAGSEKSFERAHVYQTMYGD
jgi:hypothetical protein